MNKFIIIAVGAALLHTHLAGAQKTTDPAKADIKTAPIIKSPVRTQPTGTRTAPVSDNPPAATASGPNSSDFFLTSAKATIYTGNDSKEQPSQVQMQISLAEGVGSYLVPTWEYREFAVNSSTELPFKFYYDRNYYQSKMCLTNAEKAGVKVFISYRPNFLLDAWKIEKVILTLEFRDGQGNLHPILGTKNIVFINIGALLKKGQETLVCQADQFLMPTKTYIQGD
jgi:hypothetical protein